MSPPPPSTPSRRPHLPPPPPSFFSSFFLSPPPPPLLSVRVCERLKADTIRLGFSRNAQDEQVGISYKHCDTITSRPDWRQNADSVCIITFSVILSCILSIKNKK